jgi:hypothetical protein
MTVSQQHYGALGTFQVRNGYDRNHSKSHKPEMLTFRNPVNIAEMFNHCNSVSHIWFRANDGTARQAKVNGKVRTWKRDPNRIEVPVKYGMYEYATFYAHDIARILIPVRES